MTWQKLNGLLQKRTRKITRIEYYYLTFELRSNNHREFFFIKINSEQVLNNSQGISIWEKFKTLFCSETHRNRVFIYRNCFYLENCAFMEI